MEKHSLAKLAKTWSSKDKDEALGLFRKAYNYSPSQALDTNSELTGLFYDLFSLGISGTLDVEDIGEFCRQLMISLDSSHFISSLIADLLAVLDAEMMCTDAGSQRNAFKSLVLALVSVTGEELLKERLDMDSLELSGFIQSKSSYNQKYVKTKTKLFYKQQKFNLFREESEGYSKLVAELGHESLTGVNHLDVLDSIKSLIGRFSLDPNRVLDVLLQVFECHLEDRYFFVPLLRSYPCERLTFVNVLGFKFHTYHQHDGESGHDQATPSSLYHLAAILLNEGLIDLETLAPHLSLSHEEFQELHKSIMDRAQSIAKKANIVSLADRTEEEKEKEAEAAQKQKEHHDDLLSLEYNQMLGICHACLEQGDWSSAHSIINRLPPYLAMSCPQIVESLCNLLSHLIEPLYRTHAPRGTKCCFSSSYKLPQCHSFNDLLPTVVKMFYSLGPQLHTDPILLCKLVRVGKAYFKEIFSSTDSGGVKAITPDQLENELLRWFISLIDKVVLPSLSLLHCNCGMAEEVWSMIRLLPYETRYLLYGYWKNQSYLGHPELMIIKADTLNKGKYIMKRLTKDNVKPSGRQLGKLNNSNPGIIFDYVLSQIQRYDNFIIPVVDSLKYLTPLPYDILAYCIIEALGNPQKERLKHEDTNLSSWLQGLASFCANVFKKYPIELTGLLQYVTNQLKAGKSFDLLVLKEVIQKMAGIEISDEVTTSQLEAMAGGELLKAEGGYFSQVRNTKKSSQRLREALVDSNLCLPLCLLTAQQRDCIVFKDGSNLHLKLVCSMYDNCMDTLVQFGGFLSSHLSPEEYSKRVPSLDTLIQEYRLTGDVAFFLYRPRIFSSIAVKFADLEKAVKASNEKSDRKSIMSRQEKHFVTACEEIFDPIIEAVKPLQPLKVWDDINCSFYVAFWSLSLYDLHIPKDRYNEEITKAKDAIQVLENNQEMPASKKKKEQERSQALIDKLLEEKKRQEDNNQLVLSWLRHGKDSFLNPRVVKNRTLTRFLQLCIFPRCCFTTIDAVYCAKFVQTLHLLETPQFSTLLFLDRVFSDLSYTVSACTENEVRRYGHFLSHLLEMVGRWQNSESIYSTECANTPGFISMMRTSVSSNEKQYLDFENYRHITFKWHFKLTKSLVICLESKDYIQIRNGLILLTKILPHYPKVQHLSMALEKRVEKIIEEEKEKRQDLYVLALGYAGMLKSQRPNLVPETDFHRKNDEAKTKKEDISGNDALLNGKEDKLKTDKAKTEKPKAPEKPKTLPVEKVEKPKVVEKPKAIEKPKVVEKPKAVAEKPVVTEKPKVERSEKPKVATKVATEKTEKPTVVAKVTEKTDKPAVAAKVVAEKAEKPIVAAAKAIEKPTVVPKTNDKPTAVPKVAEKVENKTNVTAEKTDKTEKPVITEKVEKPKAAPAEKATPTDKQRVLKTPAKVPKQSDDSSAVKSTGGDSSLQATPTATTPVTPIETKKVPILSLEKLSSGRVSRSGSSSDGTSSESPSRVGQRRLSQPMETLDKDAKRRKLEEVASAKARASPSNSEKTPTSEKNGTLAKPERKRERVPEKEAAVEAVKKRKESIGEVSSPKENPSEPKEKKRIMKVVKTDKEKVEIGKKRTKSPVGEKDEKVKKIATSKPPLKKPS